MTICYRFIVALTIARLLLIGTSPLDAAGGTNPDISRESFTNQTVDSPLRGEIASRNESVSVSGNPVPEAERGRSDVTGKLKPPTRQQSVSSSNGTIKKVNSAGQWISTLMGTVIVAGLILSFAWAFRKHLPAVNKILPPDVVEVLGRRFIDQKNCIQLIRCGKRILVVAHSPTHGLQTLGEITDPIEVDSISGRCQQALDRSNSRRFEDLISDQLNPEESSIPDSESKQKDRSREIPQRTWRSRTSEEGGQAYAS